MKNLNYTKEELYHILCNGVFDNYAFNYLTKYNLITFHKINTTYSLRWIHFCT